MPTRMIRDGILTSERINALSELAELFYRRLMSVVDDYGRFHASPTLLRASCYPLRLDKVREPLIQKWIAECVQQRLIRLYSVENKNYLQLETFEQRINGKSKFPEPNQSPPEFPGLPGDSPGFPAVGEGVDVVEDEGEKGAEAPLDLSGISKEAWADWHKFRNGRKGWTLKARALSLATLRKLIHDGQDHVAVINQSIERNWTGLFPVKPAGAAWAPPPGPKPAAHSSAAPMAAEFREHRAKITPEQLAKSAARIAALAKETKP